jgi:hypothetical protein
MAGRGAGKGAVLFNVGSTNADDSEAWGFTAGLGAASGTILAKNGAG